MRAEQAARTVDQDSFTAAPGSSPPPMSNHQSGGIQRGWPHGATFSRLGGTNAAAVVLAAAAAAPRAGREPRVRRGVGGLGGGERLEEEGGSV